MQDAETKPYAETVICQLIRYFNGEISIGKLGEILGVGTVKAHTLMVALMNATEARKEWYNEEFGGAIRKILGKESKR